MSNARIIAATTIAQSNFLELRSIRYQDARGNLRTWDAAGRRNRTNAVIIIARLLPDDEIVLVKQFRPPAGAYVLEFPAGLVDPGEEPEVAAARELAEETGYSGRITEILPFAYSTAGMCGEGLTPVTMTLDAAYFRAHPPVAHPEESEELEVLTVPRRQLLDYLKNAEKSGVKLDGKLLCYALAAAAN